MMPSWIDFGRPSATIALTLRSAYRKDGPRSPWTSLTTQSTYCSGMGLSSPYLALILAWTPGEHGLLARPGTARDDVHQREGDRPRRRRRPG